MKYGTEHKQNFCDSLKRGAKLTIPVSLGWNGTYKPYIGKEALVIDWEDRRTCSPLITVVLPDLSINKIDAGHFYVAPPEPPTKEMTLPEIIKELGYEVKIVK